MLFSGDDEKYLGYRKAGTPLSPGANPSYTSPNKGALASLKSVSKFKFEDVQDGASYTWAVSPKTLGKEEDTRISNLVALLDGYFKDNGGHHLNVNVFSRDDLEHVIKHWEEYPNYTLRVSGYALRLGNSTQEQREDLLKRVIHEYV